MSTLEQLKHGLENTWDSVAEGWQQLHARASQALTRFRPGQSRTDVETANEQVLHAASRWGLLAAEVSENDAEIEVRLEAPGMEADDFDIDVIDTTLVVRGEKRVAREHTRGHYYTMECAYGSFERALPLPASVDENATRARYRRGILTITLPKTHGSKGRRIPVES